MTAPPPPPDFSGNKYLVGNALVCGDNLDILRELPDECIDLIYLDPPFNSDHNYVAVFGDKGTVDAQLRDIWRWTVESENQYQRLPEGPLLNAINAIRLVRGGMSSMAAYALFMGRRLTQLHRVLKVTGSIYLHCSSDANWLLRILLDAIFGGGDDNFLNEIVWQRTSAHPSARKYANIHEVILFYSRSADYKWHRQLQALNEHYVKTHYIFEDDRGRYRAADLTGAGTSSGPSGQPWRGFDPKVKGRHWAYVPSTLDAMDKDGLIHWPKKQNGWPGHKVYLTGMKGRPATSIWTDIPPINSQAKERIGYPTQKPLALLERIIQASSNTGDLVLDPFCGCGTAADAAAKLGRGYLGIDVSSIAVRVMEQRLASRGGSATPVVYKMSWDEYDWEDFERRALMHETDAEDGIPGWAWAEDKVAGLLNAVPNSKKVGDGGVDARYFTEAGEVIPIQVKMHQGQVGRPDLQKLLGVQTEWQNKKVRSPMSLMVTLYPPAEPVRVYAAQQGKVTLRGEEFSRLQVLSVQEMLVKQYRPKLPPVDPRYFVGDTQTRLAIPGSV